MKAIIIKGVEMPEKEGFLDARIYGDGTVLLPTHMGECDTVKAEEVDIHGEYIENHKEENNMNNNQIESMREKVMGTEQKVYNTKVYQYWINGNGELCRAKRDELDTVECKVEVLG